MPANPTTKATLELNAVDNTTAVIKRVQGSVTDLTGSYDKLKGTLLGLSGAIGATYFAHMIESTIEAEAALLRLSERTGNTVEALSSLTKIAKLSGTDMDNVATGMQKLAKSMAEAESGTGKAGKVFDALKISIRDANTGALRPTQEIMQELGQKLMAMRDQTLAVAFAQELLGKNGAALLPFLYELARAGELHVKVTTEQAQRAKEFEDNLVNLKSASVDFWRHLANDMLPTMNKYVEQLIKGRDIAGGWFAAIRLMGSIDPGKSVEANLSAKERELADWQGAGPVGRFFKKPFGATYAGTEGDLQKQIEFLKFMRAQDYQDYLRSSGAGIAGTDSSDVARMGSRTDVKNPLAAGEDDSATNGLGWTPYMEEMWQAQKKAWDEAAKIKAEDAKILADLIAAGEKYNQVLAKRTETVLDSIDPSRLYAREQRDLQELVDNGRISEEQATQALRKWFESKNKVEDLGRATDVTADAAHAMGLSFTSALERVTFGAKQGIDALSLLKATAMDVAKVVYSDIVTKPLSDAITSGARGFSLSSLTGGSSSGIGTGMTPGMDLGGWLHSGGIVGSGEGRMGYADSRVWAGAPRFHSGLMPDEFPAVLQKGEGVFTQAQMKALGGVTIKMENHFAAGFDPVQARPLLTQLKREVLMTVAEARKR